MSYNPNQTEPDECEHTLDCTVCGCEVPATLEWADPDFDLQAERTCDHCGEPLCDDCQCCTEDEDTDPVMVMGAATNEGKASI